MDCIVAFDKFNSSAKIRQEKEKGGKKLPFLIPTHKEFPHQRQSLTKSGTESSFFSIKSFPVNSQTKILRLCTMASRRLPPVLSGVYEMAPK